MTAYCHLLVLVALAVMPTMTVATTGLAYGAWLQPTAGHAMRRVLSEFCGSVMWAVIELHICLRGSGFCVKCHDQSNAVGQIGC
jgi:hypothetical protein